MRFPLLGLARDLHPLANAHAERTAKRPCKHFAYKVFSLLINATSISIADVSSVVSKFDGICYPAHIDRDANGIIAILGSLPEDTPFDFYELNDSSNIEKYSKKYGISADRFIISSDAHYLTNMRDKENFFELEDEPYSAELMRHRLFDTLRRQRK